MLVSLSEILEPAGAEGYAVPAFNVYNMETVMGVAQAAKKLSSPVIFQVYSRLFEQGKGEYLAPIILEAIRQLPVPAVFHLDHGSGQDAVIRALRCGASGIMIDASLKPLEENTGETRRIVELCRAAGVPVEGELGHIGSTKDEMASEFTRVDEAVQFVEETKVDALAVMIGTAHGKYKKAPQLNLQRAGEIGRAVKKPLVLHGGSGVPDEQVKGAIAQGVAKVNFGTDLCCAFLDGIKKTAEGTIAIDLFMNEPIAAVKEFAMEKIRLLGADGHA
ncbi:class II fructose-bisphosphate aldolase [bacterium 1xD8-48]|nr:class II fructose-bisphosphate aldolase [bacterium 1xD8-48]